MIQHTSLPSALIAQVEAQPDKVALITADGTPWSRSALLAQGRRIATALIRDGLAPGQKVAILAPNTPMWLAVDLGIQMAGGVVVPLYTTGSLEDTGFILRDSGANRLFVGTTDLLDAITPLIPRLPALTRIWVEGLTDSYSNELVHPLERLEELDVDLVAKRIAPITRQSEATIVYTSGTGGLPKGVVITQGNLMSNIEGTLAILEMGPGDRTLSFLPLSHIFERMVCWLCLLGSVEIAFARKPETVVADMERLQPTVVVAVPRFYSVVRSRILAQIARLPGWQRHWMERAFAAGHRWSLEAGGNPGPRPMGLRWLDRLFLKKVRAKFGGKIRFFVSGSAPLPEETFHWYRGLGLPIVEGYGMTESSPVLTVSPIDNPRPGSVGKAIPNVELKIADDGEILAQGPSIMLGYHNQEDASAHALQGGWLHTGDIGTLDDEGFLRITDRKKDLIVNSGGKNIAPGYLESLITSDPLISQAMVLGDRQPHLGALIVLDPDQLAALCVEKGLEQPVEPARLEREVLGRIRRRLQDRPSFEQIRRVRILSEPFSIASGELTATLKLRRKVVIARHAEAIASLFPSHQDETP